MAKRQANSESEMRSALKSASDGDTIVVAEGVRIDGDNRFEIPAGVTLKSNLGSGGNGAVIEYGESALDEEAVTMNDGASLVGFRIYGPNDFPTSSEYSDDTSDGIYVRGVGCLIEACEVAGFGHRALHVAGDQAAIRYCDVHDVAGDGYGYGVGFTNDSKGGLVEHCHFEFNRHSIATNGQCTWEARNNWVAERHDTGNHAFDCHGQGDSISVHHNTFAHNGSSSPGEALRIRGSNSSQVRFTNNWVWYLDDCGVVNNDEGCAVSDQESAGDWEYHTNHFGTSRPPSSDIGVSSDAAGVAAYGEGGGEPFGIEVDGETTLTASQARTSADAEVRTAQPDHTGSGFLDIEPDTGGWVEWPLNVKTAGMYDIEVRFANGDANQRVVDLTVGGSTESFAFPPTGDWHLWQTKTVRRELPGGGTSLRIESTGDDAAHIDRIRLLPSIVTADFTTEVRQSRNAIHADATPTETHGTSVDSYEWSVTYPDGSTDSATGQAVNIAINGYGSYEITLTAVASSGQTDSKTKTKTVNKPENTAPNADFEGTVNGNTLSLSAAAASDSDGSIERYEWEVTGPSTYTRSGETVEIAGLSPGSYDVTLTVTDNRGATGTSTATFNVGGSDGGSGNETALIVMGAILFDQLS